MNKKLHAGMMVRRTITMTSQQEYAVKQWAHAHGRSVSGYLQWLITNEMKRVAGSVNEY
jgi:hypothetical protein